MDIHLPSRKPLFSKARVVPNPIPFYFPLNSSKSRGIIPLTLSAPLRRKKQTVIIYYSCKKHEPARELQPVGSF
jgi:hypothetical protein